jgi:hypothetical protein
VLPPTTEPAPTSIDPCYPGGKLRIIHRFENANSSEIQASCSFAKRNTPPISCHAVGRRFVRVDTPTVLATATTNMPKNKWTAHQSIQDLVEASKVALQNFNLRRRELAEVNERMFPRIEAPSGRVYLFGQGSYALLIALYNGALLGEFMYTKSHLQSSAQRFLQENSFFDTFGYTPWSCMGAMWRKDGSVYYHQILNFRGRRPSASSALYALTPVGIRDAWALFQLHEAHSDLFRRINHVEYVGHPSRRNGVGSRVNALAAHGVSSGTALHSKLSDAASQHASPYRHRRTPNKRPRSSGRARKMSTDEDERDFSEQESSLELHGKAQVCSSPLRQTVGGATPKLPKAENAAAAAARHRLSLSKAHEDLATPRRSMEREEAAVAGTKRRRDSEDFIDISKGVGECYQSHAEKLALSPSSIEEIEEMIATHCRLVDWAAVDKDEPESVPTFPAELDDLPEDADLEILEDGYGSLVRVVKHFHPPAPSADGTLDMTDLGSLSYTLEAIIIGYTTAQAPPDYHLVVKPMLLSLLHRSEKTVLPATSSSTAAVKPCTLPGNPACATIVREDSLDTSQSWRAEILSDKDACCDVKHSSAGRDHARASAADVDLTEDQSQIIID